MSRVVVATLGSLGDLHPFLAVARGLVEQGHSVLFLSSEPHRAAVEAEGLRFESVLSAKEHHRAAQHTDLWHPIRGFGVLWRHLAVRSIDAVVDTLTREVSSGSEPVRVLASPLVLGARLAVDTLPIRLITAHTAPSGLRSLAHPLYLGAWPVPSWWPQSWRRLAWRALDAWKLQPMALPAINRWRAQQGLAPVHEPIFDRWLHSPHRVVALFPSWFSPAAQDLPVAVQHVGFPLFHGHREEVSDPALEAWLQVQDTPSRIVVYGGSTSGAHQAHFAAAAQALDQKGWPVLLIAPGTEPAELGRRGLVRPWADLRHTLQHCQGWLHHGGVGACAEGFLSGTRQWTNPSAYDQFDNTVRTAQRQDMMLGQVMVNLEQLRAGDLPGLQQLSRWPHRPRLSQADGGPAAIHHVMKAVLGA
jgi:rhamnosyltransferase subunit B